VLDWGPLPADPRELHERTDRALARRPPGRSAASIAPEEVDEIRIVQTWIAAHEPPVLSLREAPDPARLAAFVETATG
jgi:hypothetical protein